ncbi:MAG: primase [Bacteroidetes bacterium]|nr:primase [Bacteroidota bacterium]
MRIPDEKIEEVRSASDIVDVISAYVSLKKRGKSYVGRCPFHQEKTPSFTVSPEKQVYHCFGCGAGGNVFGFVMQFEKVTFVEAVRSLAERAGIVIPTGRPDDPGAGEYEALYAAVRSAGVHFHENLVQTVEGRLGLEYLKHRGLVDETIRKFGLGYSLNGWDGLVKLAQKQGLDLEVLDRAGLLIRRDDGTGYYDRFRGRIMIPIFLPSGRTIAFGARKLREDDPLGKYINSPETPIYSKSAVLYGLSHTKESIRERSFAVLVEGYLDLLSLFQAGVQNVVASSGTALTPDQVRLIGRYTRSVTIVYDADSAGSKAAMRGVDIVLEGGLDVNVVELPGGEDPDSYVRKEGGPAFEEMLQRSTSFLEFKAALFEREGLFRTPEGKTRAVRSIVETVARIGDELKRAFFIKRLAERFGLYESLLQRELEGTLARERRGAQGGAGGSSPKAGAAVSTGAPKAGSPAAGPLPAAERDLLRVVLEQGKPMADYVFSRIPPGSFTHPHARALAERLSMEQAAGWDVTSFLDHIDDDSVRRLVTDLVMSRYDISRGWSDHGVAPREADPADVVRASILTLRMQDIDRRLRGELALLQAAEDRGESLDEHHERIAALQQEKRTLAAEREAGAH